MASVHGSVSDRYVFNTTVDNAIKYVRSQYRFVAGEWRVYSLPRPEISTGWLGAVVASFVARTKLLYAEPG